MSSLKKDRTKVMSLAVGSWVLGLSLGPVIQVNYSYRPLKLFLQGNNYVRKLFCIIYCSPARTGLISELNARSKMI